jgi:hypothetical protein
MTVYFLFFALFCLSIFDSHAQNVGIGETAPASKLAVKGSLSVGSAYSTTTAPTDGAIIFGNVGIGTASPSSTLQVVGTISTTNLQMTSGATNGYILKSDAGGNASWVNPTSITTGTTVSNTISGNTLSTTVNGVTGAAVTVPNIYTADGTLTGARTVTDGANNLTFTSSTGNLNFTTTSGVNQTTGGNMAMGNSVSASGGTSVAFGTSNTSSGVASFSTGWQNTASGALSTAFGQQNTASGYTGFVVNIGNAASGGYTTASGKNNTASGDISSVTGQNNTAYSYAEHVIGINSTAYTPASTSAYSATDRIFNVGNGASTGARSDAMTILKNGNTGIGVSSPANKLEVAGNTKTTNLQMTSGATANYLLQSDASGNGTWVNPNTIAANNIYNSDGTLTGTRTITMGSNNLIFNTSGTGKVGIGYTSPGAPLEVRTQSAYTTAGYDAIVNLGGNSSNASAFTIYRNYANSQHYVGMESKDPASTAKRPLVMQEYGGNVGIATNNPAYPLDVNGVVNAASGYKVAGGSPSTSTYLKGNGSTFVAGTIAAADLSAAISGTTNYVAKFTGANTIGNGIMYDNGSAIGIGTTAPMGTVGFVNNGSNIAWGAGPYTSIYDNANVHYWTDDATFYESGATGTGASFNWLAGQSVTGTGGTSWMYLNNAKLGIGTTAPSNTLHLGVTNGQGIDIGNPNDQMNVAGGGTYAIRFYGYRDVVNYAISAKIVAQRSYQCCSGSGTLPWLSQGTDLAFYTNAGLGTGGSSGAPADNSTERMRIKDNGYIGVGTATPAAPLDVEAVNNTFNEGSYRWFALSGNNTASCGSCNVSIYTPNRIEASEFDANSDRRIKKEIKAVTSESALEKANRLNVVTFKYIDQKSKGNKNKTGFIAQEVEPVLPNAVNQDQGFIPNVFDIPAQTKKLGTDLMVTTTKDHDFAAGDLIRIYDDQNKAKDVLVAKVVGSREFMISDWSESSDSLFIYGKKVYDYRNVDFDQLTAISIGAVQELSKKLNEEQIKNQALRQQLSTVQQQNKDARTDIDKLKASVETLQQIVGAKTQK